MSKVSTRIQNRLITTEHTVSSVDVHGEKVSSHIASHIPSLAKSEMQTFLKKLRNHLSDVATELDQKEKAYVAEQSDDPAVRKEREKAHTNAVNALSVVRNRLLSFATDGQLLQAYNIPTLTPTQPNKLFSVLDYSATLLQASKESFADPLGGKVKAKHLGDYLAKVGKSLGDAIEKVKQEERELQESLLERDKALERWEQAYQGVAGTLKGLYQLAGLGELADRIRPTNRRRRGEETATQPANEETQTTPESPTTNAPS